ncbi:MAG TPA: SAM-dependent methyltransferase [Candidatus Didemnitutus sp.]|nr:SAM-dependent methyltransferase [Candidatus Didemnitutus sp.]
MLFLGQHGYESLLAGELTGAGLTVAETGPGWARAEPVPGDAVQASLADFAFPHLTLIAPTEFAGESVNVLAQQVADFFLTSLRGERIETAWPCVFLAAAEVPGLAKRVASVEKAFRELVRKKLARVERLAVDELPRGMGPARGLVVFFPTFHRAFAVREIWRGGQRRMADDAAAPSRSYLKTEEAFVVLGSEPAQGDTVCDLGAAPGGWSYSAAKRGARVVAIDNGPLKGGALNHPLIEHRREDAFRFAPAAGQSFDWLFCDLVEEPHHVLRNLVGPWLRQGWCRRFVVNLKFGRADPLALLREIRAADSPLAPAAGALRIRHLYHDREEFTVVGALGPARPS